MLVWDLYCQTSDLVLMILDATKRAEQRALLEAELDAVGIRLNKEPPWVLSDLLVKLRKMLTVDGVVRNIALKAKKVGGMKITFQTPPKNVDEKMISNVLRDYKLLNCEVLVRDENGIALSCRHKYCLRYGLTNVQATIDDVIDVIMKDHRKYIKW